MQVYIVPNSVKRNGGRCIRLNVLKDIPDNRILEYALEAGADLVVTGDRHLLQLKKIQGIPIIRLADFLRMFLEDVN